MTDTKAFSSSTHIHRGAGRNFGGAKGNPQIMFSIAIFLNNIG